MVRILILGGDGYLGWPTAMAFCARGDEVRVVDNYLRRSIACETHSSPLISTPLLPDRTRLFEQVTGKVIEVAVGDCCDFDFLGRTVQTFEPDVIVHFAEQASAPYSMLGYDEAKTTFLNNLTGTFNVVWAILQYAPDCHLIKLGSMGEYGTPNIDIEEGWINIEYKNRRDRFLFPRQAGSLYHATKVSDTDLLFFYARTHGMYVTDLMQGPVYGYVTAESSLSPLLATNLYYDDIFGTVINRFVVQAAAGMPLTVYGKGDQTRGYLNIIDTLQCIALAAANPPAKGEMRILNQFTELFTVNLLAKRVQHVGATLGLSVEIAHIDNPRQELEEHYYNAANQGIGHLGLSATLLTDEIIARLLEGVLPYRDRINVERIKPRVRWPSTRLAER